MMLPERRSQHQRHERLRDVEDTADVHRVDAIEIGAVGLQDRADVADARAVDQDVEAAGVGQHPLRRRAHCCSSVTSSANATAGARVP